MPRLFTAIEVPREIGMMLSAYRGGVHGARWVDPDNYHLTLRFIGDIDERTAYEAADMLDLIERPSFNITLNALEQFGGKKPRAIFAAAAPSTALVELQAEQERMMRRIGLAPESRKFTPHVTLARMTKPETGRLQSFIEGNNLFKAGPFTVDQFTLFESLPGNGGPVYTALEDYPLS
jgi:2'-5' RNA ligase